MAKFRKKEVLVEAVQLLWSTWDAMCELAGVGKFEEGKPEGCYVSADGHVCEDGNARMGLRIPSLRGVVLAVEKDWVVRDVDGELRPYTPAAFEEAFEPATDPSDRRSGLYEPDWDLYPALAGVFDSHHIDPVIEQRWEEMKRLLIDARADGVRFVRDVRGEELAKARADERRRLAAIAVQAKTGASAAAAATVRELSNDDLLQALRNVGCDLKCDACVEAFFTGFAAHEHTCKPDNKTGRAPSFDTMQLLRGALAACRRADADTGSDFGDVGDVVDKCGSAIRTVLEELGG